MVNQGDGAHMDTDGVRVAMTGLTDTGGTFHSNWSTATAAGTGGLGQGPLGAAFLTGFNPGVERLGEEASRIARGIRDAADAGHGAVADYRAADDSGYDSFRRTGSGDADR